MKLVFHNFFSKRRIKHPSLCCSPSSPRFPNLFSFLCVKRDVHRSLYLIFFYCRLSLVSHLDAPHCGSLSLSRQSTCCLSPCGPVLYKCPTNQITSPILAIDPHCPYKIKFSLNGYLRFNQSFTFMVGKEEKLTYGSN